MPICWRTSCCFSTGFIPSISRVPLVGASRVVSILMVVVFPAPLGPRKAKISPLATSKETLSTAVKSPNFFTSCCTRIIGSKSSGQSERPWAKAAAVAGDASVTHGRVQEFRILNGSVQFVNEAFWGRTGLCGKWKRAQPWLRPLGRNGCVFLLRELVFAQLLQAVAEAALEHRRRVRVE